MTLAIFIGWEAVVGGPAKVGTLGCVAMTVLGKIGVKVPVSAGRAPDPAPEEEARARLAGVMLGKSMPGTVARLPGTTGPVNMAVAGRFMVGTVAGLILLGCISSSTFAQVYIAEGTL